MVGKCAVPKSKVADLASVCLAVVILLVGGRITQVSGARDDPLSRTGASGTPVETTNPTRVTTPNSSLASLSSSLTTPNNSVTTTGFPTTTTQTITQATPKTTANQTSVLPPTTQTTTTTQTITQAAPKTTANQTSASKPIAQTTATQPSFISSSSPRTTTATPSTSAPAQAARKIVIGKFHVTASDGNAQLAYVMLQDVGGKNNTEVKDLTLELWTSNATSKDV